MIVVLYIGLAIHRAMVRAWDALDRFNRKE
jgi:hypothetical protein